MIRINLIGRPFSEHAAAAIELRKDIETGESLINDGFSIWGDDDLRVLNEEDELGSMKAELEELEKPLNELFYEANHEKEEDE